MSRALETAVEQALAGLARRGATGDATGIDRESLEVRVRGEEIDRVTQAHQRVLRVRAFLTGEGGRHQAATRTSDLSADAIETLVEESVAIARATAVDAAAGLPQGGFATALPDLGLDDPGERPWKLEERIEAARTLERSARAVDRRLTNSEGSEARSRFSHVVYGNTHGFLGTYTASRHTLYAEPIAETAGEKQRDWWFSASRSWSGLEDAASVGRVAGERAVGRLGARAVSTCEAPVIFEARVAGSLLQHLFACVSGAAIYRRASCLLDRIGEAIASPRVTILDDGRVPGALGSRPFDAEGLPTRRNLVVHEGRLERYLCDTYAARRIAAEATGSATAEGIGPTNLWLEPGEATLDALVADTPRGLLVTEMMGMGFNPVTGDYSRGAGGVWIENGSLTHPVQEVTVAGNLLDMLRAVDAVACDLDRRAPVASPSVRIARMTVAGS